MIVPPKPAARARRVSLWSYGKLFRSDILSAQPAHLYRAKMAEFRTPFFRSYLVNQPSLIDTVLKTSAPDFPKSSRVAEGLRPLLGNSVFLSNGAVWAQQRRIIDPAFAGGRLRQTLPAMWAAADAACERLLRQSGEVLDIEPEMSHVAADVIFRALFSLPIEHEMARRVFKAFSRYQRGQPLFNLAAFLRLPDWVPRRFPSKIRHNAAEIRQLIARLTDMRSAQIAQRTAPDDLATLIMTQTDPDTGERLSKADMVDQVAIFFLAGHETSAAALSWALYLLALHPVWQERMAEEATMLQMPDMAQVSKLRIARDVFRETLRLYPPVPMMVREAACPVRFRNRDIPKGSQIVVSPWHVHRHEDLWVDPDKFDPGRWSNETSRVCNKSAYLPFSAGPRVCPGAGFAMLEAQVILARIVQTFRIELVPGEVPVPVAHLTVRSKSGIRIKLVRR